MGNYSRIVDWTRASVTDYRFKPRAVDLCTKEKKSGEKRKKGEIGQNFKHTMCMPRHMHMGIGLDVVIY